MSKKTSAIEYIFEENGKSATLIFLHGLFGSCEVYESISGHPKIKAIANSIRVDFRHHGQSSFSGPSTIESFSDDLFQLINDLNLANVYLVGHSMGGRVAIEFAGRFGSLISGIAVLDMTPMEMPRALLKEFKLTFDKFSEINLSQEKTKIVSEIYELFHDHLWANYLGRSIIGEPGSFRHNFNYAGVIAMLPEFEYALPKKPFYGRVKFLSSDNEVFVSKSHLPEFKDFFPKLDLEQDVIFENCGHFLLDERLDECAELLVKLVQPANDPDQKLNQL